MFWDKWKTGGLIRNPASSQGLNEDAGMPMRILMKRPITKTVTLFLVVSGGKMVVAIILQRRISITPNIQKRMSSKIYFGLSFQINLQLNRCNPAELV